MATALTIDIRVLREAIQHEYEEVAACPTKGFHFHVGRPLAQRLGYAAEQVDPLPDSVVESFAGVGNPFALGPLAPEETVVDLGSGAGFDAILAARQVGESGRVVGIDMTRAMLEKARDNALQLGLEHATFREGYIEELPVDSESIDVVISNGVINLSPDKEQVFAEIFRVLKPGGRIQIADIIVGREVPLSAQNDIRLWTG
ncbi:MAG TPA: methyltransferase domain-containing protein [Thermomicrobiales bacterium]|nr:methyltransferase domain-containing protein [Thermomicrobiales bacterium]